MATNRDGVQLDISCESDTLITDDNGVALNVSHVTGSATLMEPDVHDAYNRCGGWLSFAGLNLCPLPPLPPSVFHPLWPLPCHPEITIWDAYSPPQGNRGAHGRARILPR